MPDTPTPVGYRPGTRYGGFRYLGPSGDTSGVTDAANINAALAAMATAGGGTLRLAGNYYVNATIQVPGLCTLDGTGGGFVKQVNGANLDAVLASPAALTTGSSVNYDAPLSIIGVTVNGNRANQTAGLGNGILVSSGANTTKGGQTTIRDCMVFETMSNGICVSEINLGGNGLVAGTAAPYTGEARIERNRVYNAGANGIWMRGGGLGGAAAMTDGYMVNNVVGYTTHDGIRVDSAGGWIVDGNHPYGTGLSGIVVTGAYSTRIQDNYIEGVGVLDTVTQFGGSSAFSAATTWASGTTYGLNDVVIYNNVIYKSKVYANVGNQPDTSTNQWGAYAISQRVCLIAAVSAQSARPLSITDNQCSLGHASWGLNSNFQYTGIFVSGPASGTSKATVYASANDLANELQAAGTNTTAVRLASQGAGPSGVNLYENNNRIRGNWNSTRSADSTCAPTGSVGAGASGGTGASITVTGNNQAGNISVVSGNSGLASGALASVSYTTTQAVTPRVVVFPRSSAAAALGPLYVTTSTTGFTINASVAPASNTTYSFDYVTLVGA